MPLVQFFSLLWHNSFSGSCTYCAQQEVLLKNWLQKVICVIINIRLSTIASHYVLFRLSSQFSEVFCSQNHLFVAQESSISGGSNKSFTMNYCITWHTERASHGDLYASSQANHILPCNKETAYFDINKHQRDYEVQYFSMSDPPRSHNWMRNWYSYRSFRGKWSKLTLLILMCWIPPVKYLSRSLLGIHP